ncbi:MAG: sterol desaturase family protein, partial [Gammaproteobacteria bacterium]|nr:sterol desaturase family protein [Gammaproteobacteria bacterium]
IDKNYGGCLIIWDRIFGTFEPEDEPVEYGITKPLKSQDPVSVLFHGFWRLGVKLTTARSAGEILYCFIKPPGWQTSLERERHAGLEGLPYLEKTI